MDYEVLLAMAEGRRISVYEEKMTPNIKGLYADEVIWINRNQTTVAKACAIIEEIAHHQLTVGDILDQTDIRNRKQELRARQWAYECMLPLDRIVQAYYACVSGRYDLADFLGVTEEFLQASIDRYTEKHGKSVRADEEHIVLFEPLGVIKIF